MALYRITYHWVDTYSGDYEIEADSPEEARRLFVQMVEDGEIGFKRCDRTYCDDSEWDVDEVTEIDDEDDEGSYYDNGDY